MKNKKSFINRIYREKDIKKIDAKINQFGVSKKFTTEYFMNFRLFTSMIVFVVLFFHSPSTPSKRQGGDSCYDLSERPLS